jgi:hypothetical protein
MKMKITKINDKVKHLMEIFQRFLGFESVEKYQNSKWIVRWLFTKEVVKSMVFVGRELKGMSEETGL